MTLNKRKALYIFMQILFIILINGGIIAFFVMNVISYKAFLENGKVIELSFWDALSNKAVNSMGREVFKWLPEYHFYNKLIVYIVMFIGVIGTFKFSVIFHKLNKNLKPTQADEIAEMDLYKKLLRKSKDERKILSKKEVKKLEYLIRKFGGVE